MFFVFFLFWVILNGRFTIEIAVLGVIIAALIYAFLCHFMNWNPKKDLLLMKMTGFLVLYFLVLILEILKANIATIKMIFSVRNVREPVLVKFRTRLTHPVFRVLLANSITLTPGTITVTMEEDVLTVHALDREFAEDIDISVFVRLLEKAERKWIKNE